MWFGGDTETKIHLTWKNYEFLCFVFKYRRPEWCWGNVGTFVHTCALLYTTLLLLLWLLLLLLLLLLLHTLQYASTDFFKKRNCIQPLRKLYRKDCIIFFLFFWSSGGFRQSRFSYLSESNQMSPFQISESPDFHSCPNFNPRNLGTCEFY